MENIVQSAAVKHTGFRVLQTRGVILLTPKIRQRGSQQIPGGFSLILIPKAWWTCIHISFALLVLCARWVQTALTPSSGFLCGLGTHWYGGFWCFCQLHIPPRERTCNVVSFYVPSLLLLFRWTKRLLQPSISDIKSQSRIHNVCLQNEPLAWGMAETISLCFQMPLSPLFISVSKNDIGILKLTETETICRTGMLDCSKLRPAASLFKAQIQCCPTSRCCTAQVQQIHVMRQKERAEPVLLIKLKYVGLKLQSASLAWFPQSGFCCQLASV